MDGHGLGAAMAADGQMGKTPQLRGAEHPFTRRER